MKSSLTTESVEGSALSLQSIDDIHGGDSLPLGVLGVGDSVTDDVLKEDLEDTSGLLVDEARDTLDTTSASQTADGGLGDALDVVTKDLSVTLGASLSESLASFTTSGHVEVTSLKVQRRMMSLTQILAFICPDQLGYALWGGADHVTFWRARALAFNKWKEYNSLICQMIYYSIKDSLKLIVLR